ncbi:hypothetical protein C475_22289 [Halosimplex carlsbadense 2-9-1]|uniref:Uncharacterized protein n=1 Tax=Halosimplex carlsbadense 2-9-1 TaxID=797114 RepID=M0C8X4_9EURY|nr:hypothetical protein C475_22289 [Halosimplex carlsbadense 2-9-1]
MSAHRTRIKIADSDQYAWLDAVRDDLGLTWRGLMLKAEQRLLVSEQGWLQEPTAGCGDRTAESQPDVAGEQR